MHLRLGLGLFRTRCSIEFQGPCSGNLNLSRSENYIFGIYIRSISFLSMPYSCITIQFMKIKSRLFQVHNRKRGET